METLLILEQYRGDFCARGFGGKNPRNRLSFPPRTRFFPIPVHRFSSADDYNNPPISDSIDFDEQSCFWAGPTYSNSPPASSLPIPKFSIRRTRTVSLELGGESIEIHPIVKSAPPSPTRGRNNHHHSCTREPFHGADSATRTLRRILKLAVDSEILNE